jgi:CDP-glucose 4,6-dehydratase
MFNNKYLGKTVVITGHTGFKGSWLTVWLKKLGANVIGISLDPLTIPSHFIEAKLSTQIQDLRIDIREGSLLKEAISLAQPDFVFHLAAQALVHRSYEDPIETWQTNTFGTLNLLEGLRGLNKPCAAVIITSDKCYDNLEWVWGYRESDALGGVDPYSASKGAAELAVKSYIKSYFPEDSSIIRIASARAGNVIGGGDWSENRIVPDCIKAWSNNAIVNLRNPNSTRPWQHVLEPLSGYLTLAASLLDDFGLHGQPFNFGPHDQTNFTVLNLVEGMSRYWDQVRWELDLNSASAPYEAGLLKLNCDKSLHFLKWHSVMSFQDAVRITTEWYRHFYQKSDQIIKLTQAQIEFYTSVARDKGLKWTQ